MAKDAAPSATTIYKQKGPWDRGHPTPVRKRRLLAQGRAWPYPVLVWPRFSPDGSGYRKYASQQSLADRFQWHPAHHY